MVRIVTVAAEDHSYQHVAHVDGPVAGNRPVVPQPPSYGLPMQPVSAPQQQQWAPQQQQWAPPQQQQWAPQQQQWAPQQWPHEAVGSPHPHHAVDSHVLDTAWRQDQRDRDARTMQQEQQRLALQAQIAEKAARKEQERRAHEAAEAREHAESMSYNPWGRGGGGAPLRDQEGNTTAHLRMVKPSSVSPDRTAAESLYGAPDRVTAARDAAAAEAARLQAVHAYQGC